MAFAPPVKTKFSSNLAKSTWTPMNNAASNNQVFDERREIMKKWFVKWNEKQKRQIVSDILSGISEEHLFGLHELLKCKYPQEKHNFSVILPRVLTLYIFSFLDPRTLCRCSQVSWYWNYLSELDCLWRPKCMKFGWYPTYQPTAFEEKVWKRFYVNTVHELHYTKPKPPQLPEPPTSGAVAEEEEEWTALESARSVISRTSHVSRVSHQSVRSSVGMKQGPSIPSTKKPLGPSKWEPPPWRGSDPRPIDTMRYNYLNNSRKTKKRSPAAVRPGSARPGSSRSRRSINANDSGEVKIPSSAAPVLSRSPSKTSLVKEKASPRLSFSINQDFALPKPADDLHSPTNTLNGIPPVKDETCKEHESEVIKPAPFTADLSRLSIDAGKRPRPVSKLAVDKTKSPKKKVPDKKEEITLTAEKVTDQPEDDSTTKEKLDTSLVGTSIDLEGTGWNAPASDEET